MPSYVRSDQFVIHAHVAGVAPFPAPHTWQSKEGGDLEASTSEVHPGGILGSISLGGVGGAIKRSDATVKRLYSVELHPYVQQLEIVVGTARMWISWTPLDTNKQQNGDTITIYGMLKSMSVPSIDAQSGNPAMLALTMSCDQ